MEGWTEAEAALRLLFERREDPSQARGRLQQFLARALNLGSGLSSNPDRRGVPQPTVHVRGHVHVHVDGFMAVDELGFADNRQSIRWGRKDHLL
jgi:hypothetical protein